MYPLLTNIDSQFIDGCGTPLAGGKVFTYEANTTTLKATYADTDGTAINTNPIILDESGRAKIYLEDGAYRVRILNKKGALIADTAKISRYVTSTELDEFIQTIQDGVNELNQVKEALGVIVETEIENQKGVAGGLAPLDENDKVDAMYLLIENTLDSDDSEKILSAKMGKKLGDEKLNKADLSTGEAPVFAARAWVNFNGSTAEIRKSGNIATVVRDGLVGNYIITFTKPMPHADYVVITGVSNFSAGTNFGVVSQTVNGFTLQTAYGGDNTIGAFDPSIAMVAIFC